MKLVLIAALAACAACPGLAQAPSAEEAAAYQPSLAARIAAMPMNTPRAKGPSLQTAINLALAAVEACGAKGGNVSFLVTDSAAVPIVLLSGDGAGERGQLIAQTKAYTVVKYRAPSGDVKQKARTDPKLARELALNPNIGEARFGAFPLMSGGELIGTLAITGLPGGGDEACAKQAMAKVPLR
ncbi:heme-binding protein [Novosphingobium flavum]|uniref:Heme-binding protein n=1 Tax=Novosphingobium flavum TaxID=1778672 RepID=A0A7X1KMZ6_9SPHN|nr:heme-binding protein [Novosphingobium flavum]MBC2667122.1 heme-binding protein [Novosphingobium flavum]